ncbi:MAG TPA: amidohydrolase family protein [Candidatus Acidoferrales bacterium]|nr:amidohydrolase family protein [Candidatus Acidoferrales bacterium]
MKRIDAHQHFWKYDAARDSWITKEMAILKRDFTPADLLPEMSANGIDGSIAVQTNQSEQETLFLLDIGKRNDWIAGVVGWVDLCAGNVEERLRYFSQFEKLRGVRHIVQSEADDRFLLGADFMRGIRCLAQFNLTYDILIFPKQLPAAIDFVARFPEQPFVLDHMAKPNIKSGHRSTENMEWARNIKFLAAHRNVSCKLSGLITEADWNGWRPEDFRPYLDTVFEAFGAHRLMFGSDWPVCLLAGTYHRVREVIQKYVGEFSVAEQEQIFGGNAQKFYGLKN